MTISEYKRKLSTLSYKEFKEFNEEFGGGQKSIKERVREYVDNPKHERRICQLLDLQTEEERTGIATRKSTFAARLSAGCAVIAIVFAIVIHFHTRSLLKPTERPILALRKSASTHKEIQAENKLQINLGLRFINIGKHPAGDVRFRSCFAPISAPNQLKLSSNDMKCANTIYPDNEYNPWEQLTIGPGDLSRIRNLTLFYYCRLDYRDTFDSDGNHTQEFYLVYNVARKKFEHATLEQKQQFQPQINKLIPPLSNTDQD